MLVELLTSMAIGIVLGPVLWGLCVLLWRAVSLPFVVVGLLARDLWTSLPALSPLDWVAALAVPALCLAVWLA